MEELMALSAKIMQSLQTNGLPAHPDVWNAYHCASLRLGGALTTTAPDTVDAAKIMKVCGVGNLLIAGHILGDAWPIERDANGRAEVLDTKYFQQQDGMQKHLSIAEIAADIHYYRSQMRIGYQLFDSDKPTLRTHHLAAATVQLKKLLTEYSWSKPGAKTLVARENSSDREECLVSEVLQKAARKYRNQIQFLGSTGLLNMEQRYEETLCAIEERALFLYAPPEPVVLQRPAPVPASTPAAPPATVGHAYTHGAPETIPNLSPQGRGANVDRYGFPIGYGSLFGKPPRP